MNKDRASDRNKLISTYMKKQSIGLEIGVFRGNYSQKILKKVNLKKLYLLDPWIIQTKYPKRLYGGKKDMGEVEEEVRKKFKKESNVEIIKDFSTNLKKYIKDDELDWAYIDGNHSYEYVIEDLEICKDLIKNGGFILCDDYHPKWEDRGGGPIKAITEFCTKYNFTPIIIGLQVAIHNIKK